MIDLTTLVEQMPDLQSATAVAQLLSLSAQHEQPTTYLQTALPHLLAPTGSDYAVVATAEAGRWSTLAETGSRRPLPVDLLAEVLDSETTASDEGWTATRLSADRDSTMLLATHGHAANEPFTTLAAALTTAFEAISERFRCGRRLRRLETILDITQKWNRTGEMRPLLEQMAEAATRLLDADRATIFLWDQPGKTLVGRPALGVEKGELRIPDDTGVVGRVVHSGEPCRVASADAAQIAPDVDAKLGYRTRNLVCVPLTTPDGRRLGAFEVLNRRDGDFTSQDQEGLIELAAHASVALENTQQLEDILTTHRQLVDQAAADVQLIGESPPLEALRATVDRVADTDLAVLILGENGTGKEVLCRMIHYRSRRRDAPFIAVNCAALSETLLESELFGHEKGAFTDAHESRAGKFELATGGTLLLDEIGDMSPSGQAKLLRVLEEKMIVRVGGSTSIQADVRVLAATNQNLAEMVREKKFREDLYFRLNVVTLELPPLRQRGNDIILLAEHFINQFCRQAGRRTPKFSTAARKRLLTHRWPGNVRELRNLTERLAYLLPDQTASSIAAGDLAFVLSPTAAQPSVDDNLSLSEASRCFQSDYIQTTIAAAGGNMSEAADRLGLHRSNLYRKMRQLEMETRDEMRDDA